MSESGGPSMGRQGRSPRVAIKPQGGTLGHDTAAVAIRPEDLDGLRPLLAIFAANLQASRAYVSRPYAGKVALYLAEETVAALGPEMLDGWTALAAIEASTLPGDHYSLLLGPEAGRLAEELNARLN